MSENEKAALKPCVAEQHAASGLAEHLSLVAHDLMKEARDHKGIIATGVTVAAGIGLLYLTHGKAARVSEVESEVGEVSSSLRKLTSADLFGREALPVNAASIRLAAAGHDGSVWSRWRSLPVQLLSRAREIIQERSFWGGGHSPANPELLAHLREAAARNPIGSSNLAQPDLLSLLRNSAGSEPMRASLPSPGLILKSPQSLSASIRGVRAYAAGLPGGDAGSEVGRIATHVAPAHIVSSLLEVYRKI